jgi:hypothetical protein
MGIGKERNCLQKLWFLGYFNQGRAQMFMVVLVRGGHTIHRVEKGADTSSIPTCISIEVKVRGKVKLSLCLNI